MTKRRLIKKCGRCPLHADGWLRVSMYGDGGYTGYDFFLCLDCKNQKLRELLPRLRKKSKWFLSPPA